MGEMINTDDAFDYVIKNCIEQMFEYVMENMTDEVLQWVQDYKDSQ